MENLEYKKEIVNFLTSVYSHKKVRRLTFKGGKFEIGRDFSTEFSSDFVPFNDFKFEMNNNMDSIGIMSTTPWNLTPPGSICRVVVSTNSEIEPSTTQKIQFTIVSNKMDDIYNPDEQINVLTSRMEILNG